MSSIIRRPTPVARGAGRLALFDRQRGAFNTSIMSNAVHRADLVAQARKSTASWRLASRRVDRGVARHRASS
jgi:hypothetical protein